MREESTSVPGLRPAVGRMANALVAVLGPELKQGSKAYNLTKALIREMQVLIQTSPLSAHILPLHLIILPRQKDSWEI